MLYHAAGPIDLAYKRVDEAGVEGWLGENVHHVVRIFDDIHQQLGITGDIVEIGVHHGRLFFVLAAAAREAEICYAVDLFDRQDLNVDASGCGSRSTFIQYAEELFPEVLGRLRLVPVDSLALTAASRGDHLPTEGVRLFSIDGGHTPMHALNDLALAQNLLRGGGLVLLDDFFGPLWPGVTEGFFRFMASVNRRLAPLLIFENKLFLSTFSEHDDFLARLERELRRTFGEAFDHRWKTVELCGFRTLSRSRQ